MSATKAVCLSETGSSRPVTPLRAPGHGSMQLLSLTQTKPASCPSGHNLSQTSHSSHLSPTS